MLWRLQVHGNDYFVYSCGPKSTVFEGYSEEYSTLFPNLFSPLLIIQIIIPQVLYM